MKLIESTLPPPQQYQAAFEALRGESFSRKPKTEKIQPPIRSEELPQPETKFEQPQESVLPQRDFDPLAAVHRKRS
jgi:hypothetical protein